MKSLSLGVLVNSTSQKCKKRGFTSETRNFAKFNPYFISKQEKYKVWVFWSTLPTRNVKRGGSHLKHVVLQNLSIIWFQNKEKSKVWVFWSTLQSRNVKRVGSHLKHVVLQISIIIWHHQCLVYYSQLCFKTTKKM